MISFVVPAYNEEKYIAATLASIHEAARSVGEPYEIVVANDASTDATAEIARAGGARVIDVANRQIAATRNAGARASTGDMLIFVDGDTQVNAPLVAEAVAAMRAGAAGGGAPVRLDPSPWWLNVLMWAIIVPMFRIVKWAAGCFVYCTREAFEGTGGFDEQYFAAEEIFFSRALKKQGRFVMLRGFVVSSSRKLESHGFGHFAWLCVRMAAGGFRGLRKRSNATFWYPDKR
jgi:glycosyltransferase involved in cell wall biosynthesis